MELAPQLQVLDKRLKHNADVLILGWNADEYEDQEQQMHS